MGRLFQAGDRLSAICETCGDSVNARMKIQDYMPPEREVAVPDVLVLVCERCDAVVGIPPRSTPRINASRRVEDYASETIQARLPRVLEDTLDLVVATVAGPPKIVRSAILRHYLRLVAQSPVIADAVKLRSADPIANSKADGRLVVKIPPHRKAEVLEIARKAGIESEPQLLHGLALLIADDCQIELRPCHGGESAIRVFEKGAKAREKFIKELAMVIS